jgi:hypothetical protein
VVGNWLAVDDLGGAPVIVDVAIDFNADGSYAAYTTVPTSTNTAAVEVEEGTWTSTDPVDGGVGTVTFTPTQWTCRGTDPVKTGTYRFQVFQGVRDLVVTMPSMAFASPISTLYAEPATASGPSRSGYTLTYGCLANPFTPEPLAPVSN